MADAVGGGIDAVIAVGRSIVAAGIAAFGIVLGGCEAIVSDTYEYGEIEAVVERRNGDPVPGVELMLFIGARPMDFGETGEDGSHTFDFVPFGEYGVTAILSGDLVRIEELLGGPPSHTRDGIVLGEGEEATVEFVVLRRGPGDIRVVTADESGTPAAGARVELFSPREILAVETTGSTGEVLFSDIPFGVYGVVVTPPDPFVGPDDSRDVVRQDLIAEAGITERVELTFARCTGSITVEVLSSEGGGVPGFPVGVYDPRRAIAGDTTGPGGSHTFEELPCRELGVVLGSLSGWSYEEGRGTSFVDGLVVSRTQPEHVVTFEVIPCRGEIEVRVRDEAGDPVEGATLTLFNATEEAAVVGTPSSGVHTFTEVGCGEWGVRVHPPEGYTVEEGRGTSFVDGIEIVDGAREIVALTLQRG